MDVVELRVGGELMIMHESKNGSQMMANELASLLVQQETKSSLFAQQDGEIFQALTEASRQAVLDSEAAVVGETRYVDDFAARSMNLVSEVHVKEAGDADHFETICSRKLSCSEEASVDVHSEDSGKNFLKTVSIVEHALLEKSSEGLAGAPQAVETKLPSLVVKWSREVSVDVIILDGWPEVEVEAESEIEVSVAETEVSASGVEPSFESKETSPSGGVDVEPVDGYPITEHGAPSTAGVIEQGRELLLTSLDIQVGEASKDAVLTATQDEDIDLRPCPSPLAGGEPDESMIWEPTQVETINVAQSFLCSSDVDRIVTDGDSNIQHVKSTARVVSFTDLESAVEADAGSMAEQSTSAPPNWQSEGIREQPQRIWSLKNLKERPFAEPRSAVSEQAVRAVRPKAPTVVGLPWPPMPLNSADDKLCDDAVDSTDTELLESASSPSEGMEASVKEQHLQRPWSLEYLKTRPSAVEPRRVIAAQQSSSLKIVKLKAPKVMGLSWPPAPLTTADAGTMPEESTSAPPNWQSKGIKEQPQRLRTAVSEQAVRPVKPKAPTVVGLPWPPAPLTSTDDKLSVGTAESTDTELRESASSPSDGMEASVEEQHLQRLWSLTNLKKRPLVEPRSAVSEQAVRAVKPKARTVVGLSWPPMPLTFADKLCDDTVESTDIELLESASSPSEGMEASVKEQHLQMLWSLKQRPLAEPRTAVSEQAVRPEKPKAPTVVGLSWPPTPLTSADDKFSVGTVESTNTESASSPSDGMEASVEEQHLQGLWSLQYSKTRPAAAVEPRSFTTAQQSSSLKIVKLNAPKVVGLSWPPALFPTATGVFT